MPTCPQGHQSRATDWCDVCGAAIQAAPAAPPPPAPAQPPVSAPPAGRTCPHCGTTTVADALFCEACGYDFTTGMLPRRAAPAVTPAAPAVTPAAPAVPPAAPAVTPAAPAAPAVPAAPAEEESTPAAGSAVPAEPLASAPTSDAVTPPPADQVAAAATPPRPPAEEAPQQQPAPDANEEAEPPTAEAIAVAEIWIDPDWYALQNSADPMPSPGLPVIVGLHRRSHLIGRPSRSRGIEPDIDCDGDSGVSRRQAQLSTDGSRWFVEDLGSANGTFVGRTGAELPRDPIAAGQRVELGEDSRIYLGAWTRIVVRPPAPGEIL